MWGFYLILRFPTSKTGIANKKEIVIAWVECKYHNIETRCNPFNVTQGLFLIRGLFPPSILNNQLLPIWHLCDMLNRISYNVVNSILMIVYLNLMRKSLNL